MRFAHRIASLSLVLLIAAVTTAFADELTINVLSNRADLVSGDDALIEVIVPADVTTGDVHVTRNGVDVTSSFGLTAVGPLRSASSTVSLPATTTSRPS